MFRVTHQGTLDPDTAEATQEIYDLPDDATEQQIVDAALKVQKALWVGIARANERKWLKAELVKRKRRQLLQVAREKKERVDEAGIAAEEKAITTGMLKLEAEIRADAELRGENPDATMARLRAEVDKETSKAA